MSAKKVYVVSSSTSAKEDMSSSWAWRYASEIVGVYTNYQEARKIALQHAQDEVDELNRDYESNGDADVVKSYYKDEGNKIFTYWNQGDENPRTMTEITESSLL